MAPLALHLHGKSEVLNKCHQALLSMFTCLSFLFLQIWCPQTKRYKEAPFPVSGRRVSLQRSFSSSSSRSPQLLIISRKALKRLSFSTGRFSLKEIVGKVLSLKAAVCCSARSSSTMYAVRKPSYKSFCRQLQMIIENDSNFGTSSVTLHYVLFHL